MILAPLRNWLAMNTPIEPCLLEGAGFASLVAERVAAVAEGDEQAYLAAIHASPEEVERLIAGVAVPETWLFRYPRSFDLLAAHLMDRRRAGGSRLRMISIGCATGQEPYCMAMAALHAGWAPTEITIEAIDRNPEVLRVAQAAVYGPASIRGEFPAWATPFLRHDGEWIAVDDAVRRLVQFTRRDVVSWSTATPCDVVFCRNVLIYLNESARTKLVDAIAAALVDGGVLFVGHAEMFVRTEPRLRPLPASQAFALERTAAPAPQAVPPHRPILRPHRIDAGAPASRAPATDAGPRAPTRPEPRPTFDDALALADAGQFRESEAVLREIVARTGPTAPALELLGLIRMAANDVPAAQRLFEQAVYLEPDRSASLLQLAMLCERSGSGQRAQVYWDRAMRAATPGRKERRT